MQVSGYPETDLRVIVIPVLVQPTTIQVWADVKAQEKILNQRQEAETKHCKQ